MRAKQLIDGSHLDPDTLHIVYQAFDQAWDTIASRYCDPKELEHARLHLATAVLSLSQNGANDVDVLREGALLVMADKYPDFPGWPKER